jgi:UDP-glucose 4-epimerase
LKIEDSSILVTGGAGYIGSHVVRKLCNLGYRVVVVDNLSRGNRWSVDKRAKFIKTDIGLGNYFLGGVLSSNNVKAVIHLAAYAYVGESLEKPLMYYKNNCGATLGILSSMKEANVENIIFSSTCSSYGNPEYLPIDEKHQINPINPYASSKIMCEDYIKDCDVNYYIFRYFNVCGNDKSYNIGEHHNPEPHVLPILIDCALNDKEFTVNGDNFNTEDGTCVRDYINVLDLVDAHVAALERILFNSNECNKTVNLGTSKGYSILELIKIVEKCSGKKVRYKIGPRRDGDPSKLVASYNLANKHLKWKPSIGIMESVEDIIEWHYMKNLCMRGNGEVE